jgi:hypothetical protein
MVVMIDYFDYSHAQRFSSPLEERAQRQLDTYWRIRIRKTLDRLERESRRMLQLEAELSAFAEQYYTDVGVYVERLASLEALLMAENAPPATPDTMSDVLAQREVPQSRGVEMKTRYRALAKEIHPDLAMSVEGVGSPADQMQVLNSAYAQGDLPTMLRLEAEILLERTDTLSVEERLREVERAADTYAAGYRQLLNSPLNELMLRQLSARLAGWDWMQAVVNRIQRTIVAHERALAVANIAAIGDWRVAAQAA